MSNLRSEFEKLPENKAHLHNVVFDIGCGEYLPRLMGNITDEFSAYFLSGGLYAFQWQQKKIDEIGKHFQSLISECELCGYGSDQSDRAIVLIKELLK